MTLLEKKSGTPTIKEERPTGLKSRISLFTTTRVSLVVDAVKRPHRRLQSDILTTTVHDQGRLTQINKQISSFVLLSSTHATNFSQKIQTMKEGNNRVQKPTIPTATPIIDVSLFRLDDTSGDTSRMVGMDSSSTTNTNDANDFSHKYQQLKKGKTKLRNLPSLQIHQPLMYSPLGWIIHLVRLTG